tara:strand:+ start:247 stop:414 length:168 start_codon:yes stop_codon:yes gene_type:complete
MTTLQLRNKVKEMTKQEFVNYRNELENNWSESLIPLMQILSLACINKYKTTLINL